MMASFSSLCLSKQQQWIISILFIITISSRVSKGRECYKSIISFGDSFADTGNLIVLSPPTLFSPRMSPPPAAAFPPYGRSFFNRPTGRYSDGRVVIDFFAQEFGLPMVPPYFGIGKGNKPNFSKGVNFAVGGATALSDTFLQQRGIINPYTNVSLEVEMELFKKLLPSLCSSSSECNEFLNNSLILMGEIGVNDLNYALQLGFKIEVIRGLIPDIMKTISSAIQELIQLGAVTFLVAGNLPMGCWPAYLTLFQTFNPQHYDPSTGCLTWLNQLSEYYNEMLKEELNKIRVLHPRANIVYADYYQAAMQLYRFPSQFGINNTLAACCGGGGRYNYHLPSFCGYPGSKSCLHPSSHVSWDGIHLTEAANEIISKALLNDSSRTIPWPC